PGGGYSGGRRLGPRQILREVLVGRLIFAPRIDGSARYYEFTGQATLSGLLAGVVSPDMLVTPAGFEPAFPARRTLSLGWRSLTTLRPGSFSPGRDPGPDLNCGSGRWRSSSCSAI